MPPSVAVVTDSTSYLTPEAGVAIVPLQVVVGGFAYDEPDCPAWTAAATTSRPSPERFARIYRDLSASGHSGVVSVHLSARLSGTAEAASLAAHDVDIPVEVVDSGSIAMGLGFPALAAARVAALGGSLPEVATAARRCAAATRTLFYVDTLEYLRKSGRIGTAASLVGSALMIKPLLHIADGQISLLEKLRTPARAIARLEELAVKEAASLGTALEVAVQHIASPARAQALAERLRQRLPEATRIRMAELGPVVGVHVGPGMLGVTVSPAPEAA
ncbi:DegV family protein [Thermoactinospora rubra]|uniref:DegV family protein n=1 Tax=Thermoactinospora rubra TaxID=1088767 RepID=UPI000A0FF750|nr:DegV family protein [Thermoactinospora rubra]